MQTTLLYQVENSASLRDKDLNTTRYLIRNASYKSPLAKNVCVDFIRELSSDMNDTYCTFQAAKTMWAIHAVKQEKLSLSLRPLSDDAEKFGDLQG